MHLSHSAKGEAIAGARLMRNTATIEVINSVAIAHRIQRRLEIGISLLPSLARGGRFPRPHPCWHPSYRSWRMDDTEDTISRGTAAVALTCQWWGFFPSLEKNDRSGRAFHVLDRSDLCHSGQRIDPWSVCC